METLKQKINDLLPYAYKVFSQVFKLKVNEKIKLLEIKKNI